MYQMEYNSRCKFDNMLEDNEKCQILIGFNSHTLSSALALVNLCSSLPNIVPLSVKIKN